MTRVDHVIPELARFAHRYGCPDGAARRWCGR
jgi:hypothetical protein